MGNDRYVRKKALNPQTVLEFLCCAAFTVVIFHLIKSGNYQSYVAPKMVPYLYFTAAVMTVWALTGLFRVFRPQYKTHAAHCLVLAIPIVLLLLPHSSISASDLSSGYLNGKAIANLSGNSAPSATGGSASAGQSGTGASPSTGQEAVPKDEYGNELVGLDEKNRKITVGNDDFYTWISEIYTHLDKYEGYQISITGFIFKDPETMQSNEFSPARLMMSCCVADLMPVGFICQYDAAPDLEDNIWVTVTGTVVKGEYMGEPEPQIAVTEISPADEVEGYIYP